MAETPHLDGMSAQGAMFTRAYSPCPSCCPARRTLMTGQTPATQGMVGYQDNVPWDYDVTMASELTKAGYQSINIGKTHFTPRRLHLGYEQLTTPEDYETWIKQHPGVLGEHFAHGVDSNSWVGRPNHLPEMLMEENWFVNEARQFLGRRDPTRPFFLTLSFNGPHPPWCPPQVYYDQFADRTMPAPSIGDWAERHATETEYPMDVNAWRGRVSATAMHRARVSYFAYLAYLDAQVGRLLRLIRTGGHGDSFVLFTSDHGEMLGDHNLWRKTYAYEASARVPFVVLCPESLATDRNREIEQLVGWEDVMPTFLDVAGTEIPDTVEGRSVLPLLRGEADGWRDVYHGEHSPCYHPENANQFLTDRDWKYIWNPINGEEQLFNLADDPEECHDLSASESQTLVRWRDRMVEKLADRSEGLSDGEKLITGQVAAWRGGDATDLHLG